jgi:ABC-type branched-subunit amino acid transport system substrate-binding protein
MPSVIAFAVSVAFVAGPSAAWVEIGVSPNAIVFGQASILQGPLAAFSEASRQRLHGHQIRLISVDDGYQPSKSIAATRRLIEVDKSLTLIGAGGTPTAVAARPIAVATRVPGIAASTDATVPHNPKRDSVTDSCASCDAETGGASDMGAVTSRTARSRRSTG